MGVGEKFEKINNLLTELGKMHNRPFKYVLDDLKEFLITDLQQIHRLLDEIEYDIKDVVQTRYTQPDHLAQVELNTEMEDAT